MCMPPQSAAVSPPPARETLLFKCSLLRPMAPPGGRSDNRAHSRKRVPMHIGEASRRTGLTPRAIRLYESAGIIRAPARGEGGYRHFSEQDVQTLHFVRGARDLGFDLAATARLVALWRAGAECAAEVGVMLAARVAELRKREGELRARRQRLESRIANAAFGGSAGTVFALLAADRPDRPPGVADGTDADVA